MILRVTCPCGAELGAQDDATSCAVALAQFHVAHAECRKEAAAAMQNSTALELVSTGEAPACGMN